MDSSLSSIPPGCCRWLWRLRSAASPWRWHRPRTWARCWRTSAPTCARSSRASPQCEFSRGPGAPSECRQPPSCPSSASSLLLPSSFKPYPSKSWLNPVSCLRFSMFFKELEWGSDVKSLGRVRLFATPWTVAYQAPPSMGFSRQGYWSGLPFPFPGSEEGVWYSFNFHC